jgi:hypothetical protein
MEMYFTDISNPIQFFTSSLSEHFHAKENLGKEPLTYGGMFDRGIFQQFCTRFNCVSIVSGLPHNEYGQTVRLSHSDALPVSSLLGWRAVPPHLIGENLPFKPDEMTGRYEYLKKEDVRGHTLALEEFLFFEFQPGYAPDTFSKFSSSLGALRYCSEIMHTLDLFEVVLMENGVYVHLRARINDSYKPAFAMNY